MIIMMIVNMSTSYLFTNFHFIVLRLFNDETDLRVR